MTGTGPRAEAATPDQPGPALLDALRVRSTSGQTREVLDAALALVVTMTQEVVQGADGVSITLPRDGAYATVAHSNDVVLAMDHDQYDTGQGPCLDAARLGERVFVGALGAEQRWPDFVPRARAHGVETVLSSPLLAGGAAHGALNVYSSTAGALAEHERRWAGEFARQASSVLTVALLALPSDRLTGDLEQALASRTVIARAQGWLMHRDGLDADAAWRALTATSRGTSLPLREVCERLLTGDGTAR